MTNAPVGKAEGMRHDPERHQRRSIRWQDHDYAAGGTYFVTVCTAGRTCLFGGVVAGEMRINALGAIVEREWVRTEAIRAEVEIDVFAVMPNHLHGIVTIRPAPQPEETDVGEAWAHRRAPLQRSNRSLGALIAGFKQATTLAINAARGTPGTPVWQRGYHDRVVRDDAEYARIADYIVTNPERWADDEYAAEP